MGKVAEKAVAGYVNNTDDWVARATPTCSSRATAPAATWCFDAEMADLDAEDGKQRKAACDYSAKHPVDPAKQQQVARALEKLLDDKDNFFSKVPDGAAKAWSLGRQGQRAEAGRGHAAAGRQLLAVVRGGAGASSRTSASVPVLLAYGKTPSTRARPSRP